MPYPALDDVIVAVATAWRAAPLAIVRLGGREAFAICDAIGLTQPGAFPGITHADVEFAGPDKLPATALWFAAPRSYTGQNLVELHVPGCLPAVRALTARLIAAGARRALPGEFTARAFLTGRLGAAQVDGVLALIRAADGAEARQGARLANGAARRLAGESVDELTSLLAQLEAGIDFVDEEDVRFINAPELCAGIDRLIDALDPLAEAGRRATERGRAHVALAGLANAGKSTLFNALAGHERAIVSPILGTTRDVLQADVDCDGVTFVLQDCAGLREALDGELDQAAHVAAESAADVADVVLWVHAVDVAWSPLEEAGLARIPRDRCVIVLSKCDLAPTLPACARAGAIHSTAPIRISAATGAGLKELRQLLHDRLAVRGGSPFLEESSAAARTALQRARALLNPARAAIPSAELVASELRAALEDLSLTRGMDISDRILTEIMGRFCVGK